MRTDDLIADLALRPNPQVRPPLRLVGAMLAGWIVAILGLVMVLGQPLAAVPATGLLPFAVKTAFALTFTATSVLAALAAGRPGQKLTSRAALIAAPFAVLIALAALELGATPSESWPNLFIGTTYRSCITAIALGSVPVLIGTLWAYREMAPTRPAVAGLLAGLSSGGAAAVAYALYCPETTASFLLAAYTPGALLPAIAGYLLGPKLLRW
jgi:hypothetical protein